MANWRTLLQWIHAQRWAMPFLPVRGIIEGTVSLPGNEPFDLWIRMRQPGSKDIWSRTDAEGRFRIPFIPFIDAILELEQPGYVKRVVELRYLEGGMPEGAGDPTHIRTATVLTPVRRALAGSMLQERLLLTTGRSPLILERDLHPPPAASSPHIPMMRTDAGKGEEGPADR